MTSVSIAQRTAVRPAVTREERRKTSFGALVWDYMTTTDHKKIGRLYFGTSLFFFAFGGILALLIRAELAYPGMQFMHQETFNQLFTASVGSPTPRSRTPSTPRESAVICGLWACTCWACHPSWVPSTS